MGDPLVACVAGSPTVALHFFIQYIVYNLIVNITLLTDFLTDIWNVILLFYPTANLIKRVSQAAQ